MNLTQHIESLLLVATKPLTVRRIAELTSQKPEQVEEALTEIEQKLSGQASGIHLMRHNGTAQYVTAPEVSSVVTEYLKEEQAGELTRAALETLTIIAYRGPISKIQLDTIRGVNCALIVRNLLIKGLIEAKTHKDRAQTSYQVTADFIRHLGLTSVTGLPDYERLHSDQLMDQLLHPVSHTINEADQSAPTLDQVIDAAVQPSTQEESPTA
jgi:segregation and condensation protein B